MRAADPWLYGLAAACRLNLFDADVRSRSPAEVAALFETTAVYPQRAKRGIPYRFVGERSKTDDLQGCRRRGYAACADAAAAIAAACITENTPAKLCVEAPLHMPHYVHVRVIVEGVALDPYRAFRASVPASCEWLVDVQALRGGPIYLMPVVQRV